jgi:uncharacterized protein YdeI (YjbR/CyaY-like superfamily)
MREQTNSSPLPMPKDKRVDDYIAKAPEFARPILSHLRDLVHQACPEVEEALKWSAPFFLYKGILCNMAAFKNHATFGFWKGSLLFPEKSAPAKDEAMGQFGRLASLADLPKDKVLIGYIKEAMKLNEGGVKVAKAPRAKEKKELVVPDYFVAALQQHPKAQTVFEGFSYSHKKEYLEWITEAKGEDTRKRRIKQAIESMTHGKPRHWKYENC